MAQVQKPNSFKNILIFLAINAIVISYIEFGITDEERYQDGVEAYQNENYFKAYNLMNRLVEEPNAKAELLLAKLYLNGQGVDADRAQALHWFETAAKHGNEEAKGILADLKNQQAENVESVVSTDVPN